MADGDVSVKVLYKQTVGGGRTTSGVAVARKVLVVGEIVGTYVSTGLAIDKLGGVAAFGVTNLDFISLDPRIIAAVTDPSADVLFLANFDVTNNKIFLLEDSGAADPATPSDADAVTIKFLAVGDSADAPELT